jgi:molybdate transport system substrate-binding protein
MKRTTRVAALGLALLLPLSSCSSSSNDDKKEVTVLAASSLTEAFTQLADAFEKDHDGVDVKLSFGSSTTLADQAAQGAPGDALATADETSLAIAEKAGVLTDDAVVFAENQMVLVVPAGNPAGIKSFGDLNGTDWVRCADDVPCGRVANAVLDLNPPVGDPASLEVDVKSVLAKVTSGEADAGFVYATDAKAAGAKLSVIDLPHALDALTRYYIAPLEQAKDDDLAAEWVQLVTSAEGRKVLENAGFTFRITG